MPQLVMVRYEVRPTRPPTTIGWCARSMTSWLGPSAVAQVCHLRHGRRRERRPPGRDRHEPGQLRDVAAFRRFREGLADRVVAPPTNSPLRRVGSYRVLDG